MSDEQILMKLENLRRLLSGEALPALSADQIAAIVRVQTALILEALSTRDATGVYR